jgi:long-chain acyl-CoA synthetase
MERYYKNPEATTQTITPEGWLKTGDKAIIDSEGYIFIVGRLKELYKTSTGEFVAPVPIEHELIKAPFIESAIVIAEGRKYTTALLFPDLEVLHAIKNAHNATDLTDDQFLNSDFIKTETQNLITEINKHVNKCEQILDFRYIVTPLTVESGELTPTLKIRREIVSKKYEKLIDSMYKEEVSA